MNIGIVGHEAAKFSDANRAAALIKIDQIIAEAAHYTDSDPVVVSGACPLGGVDAWAEEAADRFGLEKIIHAPAESNWERGFKPRNLLIARDSDQVHVIVVRSLPVSYTGRRFNLCYHCGTKDHVKSGACWTAREAMKLGKPAFWHLIGD